jgi:hypothetical protein
MYTRVIVRHAAQIFLPTLPRTPTGKIMRRVVRQQYFELAAAPSNSEAPKAAPAAEGAKGDKAPLRSAL